MKKIRKYREDTSTHYLLILSKVTLDEKGYPVIGQDKPLFYYPCQCDTQAEVELLDNLTHPDKDFLNVWLKQCEDGDYRLNVLRESNAGKIAGVQGSHRYEGYFLIKKEKDHITLRNFYRQTGKIDPNNLRERDPKEEIRNSNWNKVPGTLEWFPSHTEVERRRKDLFYSYKGKERVGS